MFLYDHEGSAYLNATSRCPVACSFCVKTEWEMDFRGSDLNLRGREPEVDEILVSLNERMARSPLPREVVFCGFGEPTFRLDAIQAVGSWRRAEGRAMRVRLNTVGLGSLIHGRDIVPDLARWIDAVSVSLNTADPDEWAYLHRPAPTYRQKGFAASREFARRCVEAGIETRVTAVQRPGADLRALKEYARGIGAVFLARPPLD